MDDEVEYEVEDILDSRKYRNQYQYLVNGRGTTRGIIVGNPLLISHVARRSWRLFMQLTQQLHADLQHPYSQLSHGDPD